MVSRIPQAPLPASQHLNGSAPNHFQHHDTPGNPCYERSRNCYRLLQALEAIREALMAGGCLGCSSHPNSCPGPGQDGSGHPLRPSASNTAPAGLLLVEFLDVPWGLTRERREGSRRRRLS